MSKTKRVFSILGGLLFLAYAIWYGIQIVPGFIAGNFTIYSIQSIGICLGTLFLALGLLCNVNVLNIIGASLMLAAQLFMFVNLFSYGFPGLLSLLIRCLYLVGCIFLLLATTVRSASLGFSLTYAVLLLGLNIYNYIRLPANFSIISLVRILLLVLAAVFMGIALQKSSQRSPVPAGVPAPPQSPLDSWEKTVVYRFLPETLEPDILNERMMALYSMLEKGIISQTEYDEKVNQIQSQSY